MAFMDQGLQRDDTAPRIAIQLDRHGEILYTDELAEIFFGVKNKAMQGMSFFSFVHPEDVERTKKALFRRQSFRKERQAVIRFEHRQISLQGSIYLMRWQAVFIYSGKGLAPLINCRTEDIRVTKDKWPVPVGGDVLRDRALCPGPLSRY